MAISKCKAFFLKGIIKNLHIKEFLRQDRECKGELAKRLDDIEEKVKQRSTATINGDDHWFKE